MLFQVVWSGDASLRGDVEQSPKGDGRVSHLTRVQLALVGSTRRQLQATVGDLLLMASFSSRQQPYPLLQPPESAHKH